MLHPKNKSSVIKFFLLALLLCLGGGWLSGLFTEQGLKEWYPHLIKPDGTPPNITFPIVWTTLYTFMAISLTLLWASTTAHKMKAYLFFGIQLFLNFIWSYLFFYLESPGVALFDVILLLICLLLTIVFFWRHTRWGSYLLFPYLAWVTYATYLNLFIWIYN